MSEMTNKSEMTYMPYKRGMSVKRDDSVFVFVEGVTPETFEKDEDFRSGMVTSVVLGKARVQWDRDGSYEYVDLSRLTQIEKGAWIVDYVPVESDSTDTPDAPVESDNV